MSRVNWSKVKVLKPGEKLPEGEKQLHLYDYENIFRPRGRMEKEAFSLAMFDGLKRMYEHWTDPKYNDNPNREVLLKTMIENLDDEMTDAIYLFDNWINDQKQIQGLRRVK